MTSFDTNKILSEIGLVSSTPSFSTIIANCHLSSEQIGALFKQGFSFFDMASDPTENNITYDITFGNLGISISIDLLQNTCSLEITDFDSKEEEFGYTPPFFDLSFDFDSSESFENQYPSALMTLVSKARERIAYKTTD